MQRKDDRPMRLAREDGSRPRVMIVGDSAANTTVAVVLAEQFGCDAEPTPSGEAALRALREDGHRDLILLDLALPDMDGMVAVQLIHALNIGATPPVVALTDPDSGAIGRYGRACGLCGTVPKPFSPRDLFAVMKSALSTTAASPELMPA